MKLYGIFLYHKKGGEWVVVDSATDFKGVTFSGKASEFCNFFAFEIAKADSEYQAYVVDHNEYRLSVYKVHKDVCSITITSKDYDEGSSLLICKRVSEEFVNNRYSLPGGKSSVIHDGIVKYQDSREVDQLAKIKEELLQTQKAMVLNLEKALGRKEKIDELAMKSEMLSNEAKNYFVKAKDLNKCSCSLI